MDETPANYVTVEIYDQTYHLSGDDPDHIRKLAAQVDRRCAPWPPRDEPWIRFASRSSPR